jgi:hypothetical protein
MTAEERSDLVVHGSDRPATVLALRDLLAVKAANLFDRGAAIRLSRAPPASRSP